MAGRNNLAVLFNCQDSLKEKDYTVDGDTIYQNSGPLKGKLSYKILGREVDKEYSTYKLYIVQNKYYDYQGSVLKPTVIELDNVGNIISASSLVAFGAGCYSGYKDVSLDDNYDFLYSFNISNINFLSWMITLKNQLRILNPEIVTKIYHMKGRLTTRNTSVNCLGSLQLKYSYNSDRFYVLGMKLNIRSFLRDVYQPLIAGVLGALKEDAYKKYINSCNKDNIFKGFKGSINDTVSFEPTAIESFYKRFLGACYQTKL